MRSSPYNQTDKQSNGQAERFVDTFKRTLRKMEKEGNITENLPVFLQTYRTTPNTNCPNLKFSWVLNHAQFLICFHQYSIESFTTMKKWRINSTQNMEPSHVISTLMIQFGFKSTRIILGNGRKV